MEYYIDTRADMDTIRFAFDQQNLSGNVRRTGRKQVTITFPQNALKAEKPSTPLQLGGLRIVDSINVGASSITIGTRITGFGFIRIPAGNGEMLLQFFRDPIGSKWRSPQEKARAEKARQEAARKREAAKKAAARKAADKKAAAAKKKSESTASPKPPVISEVDLPPEEESPVLKEELQVAEDDGTVEQVSPVNRRPFYSVPYTYRAPVAKVGPAEARTVDTSSPPARAGGNMGGGEVVPPDPEVSGEVAPEQGVSGNVAPPDEGVTGGAAGGTIGGTAGGTIGGTAAGEVSGQATGEVQVPQAEDFVQDLEIEARDEIVGENAFSEEIPLDEAEMPTVQPVAAENNVVRQIEEPGTVSERLPDGKIMSPRIAEGGAVGQVAPPPAPDFEGVYVPDTVPYTEPEPQVEQPLQTAQVTGGGGTTQSDAPVKAGGRGGASIPQASGSVEPPAGQASGRVSAPVQGQAAGNVSPPDAGVSGQITPPLSEGSIEADELPVLGEGEAEDLYEGLGENGTFDDFYNASDAYPVEQTGQLTEIEQAESEEGQKAPTLEEKLKIAKGVLLAAEGALDEGELETAVNGFKEVSLMPYVPTEMRLRALYGKAEALTEFHRGSLADNFGEVSSSWMEAMNADTKSPNVPMALLNLGLINLKVGNMPEAKAYFNLLKTQYPNDPNIPYISYYWGEYYLAREEYEKAADQFQYLVQMFPDSKIVRDAALGLAKSLDKLGYNEQAYQIVDYIDKRWPRFYIEDLEFLLMAANTQNRLGKLNDAKGNYWAYYNLAPEAKESDIVLARIGDIYLKQGDKTAAKEIYEKAAKEFPEREGGLVAMMRLAEEGIYDDPSMGEMDKVFDRPYNLRPQKIYNRIIEKHPDSPLAPLAQLKLGMWYYWNKKYGECLGAVQDFLDKYPRSALREKASQLGTRVFDKAVPELVKDENYGRVIGYWNKYAKKNNEGNDVNDETRLGVALSFWKKEQPQRALDLIDRYLQEKQVPKYSKMALDMALGIYVEEQAWSKVTNLVNLAKDSWELDPKQQVHIEYAQAMAFENLGETERSTPLWAGLASNLLLPESSRAYAMYYMAKSSMKKKDLKKVFVYAQEALTMLLETGGDREKIKDCILMTIFAAESSGRYREALKWAAEYDKYIPLSDPEWASSRFRLAQLYEKAGAMAEWKKLMEEVAEKSPDDLYGRLATSALETHKIEQEASKFKPDPVFQ